MIKRFLPVLLFSFTLVLPFAASQAFGQAPRQMNTVERRIDTMNRQAKDFERDNMGTDRRRKDDAETAKRSRQTRLEIEEDLTALQSAYNLIVLELQTSKELKPGFTVDAARGIRKNSSRLKSNLVLPVVESTQEQKPITPPDSDRAGLKDLCKALYSFITNPIFDGSGSLNVKESTRAGNDLDLIISIAESLSENGDSGSK